MFQSGFGVRVSGFGWENSRFLPEPDTRSPTPDTATTAIGTSAGIRYRSDPTEIACTMVKYIAGSIRKIFARRGSEPYHRAARTKRSKGTAYSAAAIT